MAVITITITIRVGIMLLLSSDKLRDYIRFQNFKCNNIIRLD